MFTKPTIKKLKERINTTVYLLTILDCVGTNRHREILVKCRCKCGNVTIVPWKRIYNGQTKSCGCYKKLHARKHGMHQTRIYNIWTGMKQRCYNPKCMAYKNYGGRGITICNSWKNSFEQFYNDTKKGYKDSLTIERIDNDGNYSPENCRWATRQEQLLNSRHIKNITIGKTTRTLSEWLSIYNMKRGIYGWRVYRCGMTPQQALITPVRKYRKSLPHKD